MAPHEIPYLKTEDDVRSIIFTCPAIAKIIECRVSAVEAQPDIPQGVTIYGALPSDINIRKTRKLLLNYAYPVNISSKEKGEPLVTCSITLRAVNLKIVENVVEAMQRFWRLKRMALRQQEEKEDPETTERHARMSTYGKKQTELHEKMIYPGPGGIPFSPSPTRYRETSPTFHFDPSFPGPKPSTFMR